MGWTDGPQRADRNALGHDHADDLADTPPNWSRSRRTSSWLLLALQQWRRCCGDPHLPIVFVIVIDPVGAGFVTSLVRPGGNATGFLMFEYGLSAKWLELLREIAPGLTRAAVVRDAGRAVPGLVNGRSSRPGLPARSAWS